MTYLNLKITIKKQNLNNCKKKRPTLMKICRTLERKIEKAFLPIKERKKLEIKLSWIQTIDGKQSKLHKKPKNGTRDLKSISDVLW